MKHDMDMNMIKCVLCVPIKWIPSPNISSESF